MTRESSEEVGEKVGEKVGGGFALDSPRENQSKKSAGGKQKCADQLAQSHLHEHQAQAAVAMAQARYAQENSRPENHVVSVKRPENHDSYHTALCRDFHRESSYSEQVPADRSSTSNEQSHPTRMVSDTSQSQFARLMKYNETTQTTATSPQELVPASRRVRGDF
jgi:hypothetical protein